jgi:hypothetical protein
MEGALEEMEAAADWKVRGAQPLVPGSNPVGRSIFLDVGSANPRPAQARAHPLPHPKPTAPAPRHARAATPAPQDAQATGRVVPRRGADAAYDAACDAVAAAEGELADYLKSVRSKLACREVGGWVEGRARARRQKHPPPTQRRPAPKNAASDPPTGAR